MKFGIQAQLNPPIKVRIEPKPEVENKVEAENEVEAGNYDSLDLKPSLENGRISAQRPPIQKNKGTVFCSTLKVEQRKVSRGFQSTPDVDSTLFLT